MNCVNCGAGINEGDLFCTQCGTKIEPVASEPQETIEQPVQESEVEQAVQEPVVEQPVQEPVVEQAVQEPVVEQPVQEPVVEQTVQEGQYVAPNGQVPQGQYVAPNGQTPQGQYIPPNPAPAATPKKKKTGLVIGIVAAVVVVAFILLAIFVLPGMNLFGGGKDKAKEETKYFYVEDNELMFMDLKKVDDEAAVLTDEYMSSDVDWGDYGFIYSNLAMSSNGKICYFPSEIDDDYEFDLCYATVKKGEAEVEKIDSNVSYFRLLDDDSIIYKKSDKVYHYKNDDKTKIASDVSSYYISEDQKWILWGENEEYDDETYEYTADLYINKIDGSGDDICIEKEVSDYVGANDDFSVFYIVKKDNLYKYDREGESEKIMDDVRHVYGVDYDRDVFYYTEERDSDINLLAYLDDPYADTDGDVPPEPVEPLDEDFETEVYDEFWEDWFTETDWDAYYEAWDAYYEEYYEWEDLYGEYGEAAYRQGIRDEISEFDSEFITEDLYFFDGKDSTLVTENFEYFLEYPTEDKYVAQTKEYSVGEKISIDDLWDAYDLYYYVEDGDNVSREVVVFANGETETVDEENIETVWTDDDMMYFTVYNKVDVDDEDYEDYYGPSVYTLYSFDLSAKDFGETEELSDEMNAFEGIMNGVPYYLCDVDEDNEEGDLYAGTEEVASDVGLDSVGLLEDENAVLFTRNLDWEESTFTLVLLNGDEEEELADDVSYFTAQNTNNILYIADFDWDDYAGELFIYMNGDSESIASDVSMLYSFNKGVSGTYYGTW